MAIDPASIEDPTLRRQLTAYVKDTPTARARKRFFSGEVLTPQNARSVFGVHQTKCTELAKEAEAAGFKVDRREVKAEGRPPLIEYQVMNPTAVDHDEALIRVAKWSAATGGVNAKKKAKPKRRSKATPAKEEVVHVTAPDPKAKANGKPPGQSLIRAGRLPFTYISHGDHMLPIPALGASVEVNILKKELDGTIRVGLMVEGVQWVADITDAALT